MSRVSRKTGPAAKPSTKPKEKLSHYDPAKGKWPEPSGRIVMYRVATHRGKYLSGWFQTYREAKHVLDFVRERMIEFIWGRYRIERFELRVKSMTVLKGGAK